jgi:molecular chaperone GrpE (heat shock protein)
MSTPNPQEEITKLEAQLKEMQDNYLQADQVMKNCRDQIIAIQKAIDTHKMYLPEQAVTTVPAGFTNN